MIEGIQYIFSKTNTSGEKAYEEFYTDNEDFNINDFDSLGYIKVPHVKLSFQQVINDFDNVFSKRNCSKTEIVKIIKKYVPDFSHIDTGIIRSKNVRCTNYFLKD